MQQIQSTVRLHPDFINFKRPSPHSLFSPSAADRWLITGCSFSVMYAKDIPQEDSKYSAEGTLAHSLGEAIFRQIFYGMTVPAELALKIAQSTDDGGAEMYMCATQYVEVLTFWLNNKEVIGEVIFFGQEQGVPVFPDSGCFGTADFIIVGTKGAAIIDFKYGKGKNVKADTVQLKVYAAGLARYLHGAPTNYRVHVVIHQPRTDAHPKEHSYTLPELYSFLEVIWQSIEAANRPGLQPVEGNHCFWCPARRTNDPRLKCPALIDKQIKLAEENFAGFLQDMTAPVESATAANPKRDAALLKLHTLYPLIRDVVESTSEELKLRIQSGELVPGFHIEESFGNRYITGENDEQKAGMILSQFPQVNPWKEIPATKKLKTLSELEKEVGKNKLDPICMKKVTKNLKVLDEGMKKVLGEMAVYAQMINNGQGQGE